MIYTVKTDGKMYAAGSDGYGQLGNGSGKTDWTTFQRVSYFDGKIIKQIEAGNANVRVLTTDGQVHVAGVNANGDLGVGNTAQVDSWKMMTLPKGLRGNRLFESSRQTLLELTDGQVWGAGRADIGNLGFRSYNLVTKWDRTYLTNAVTLAATKADGTTEIVSAYNVNERTAGDIYKKTEANGVVTTKARIVKLVANEKTSYMVDASGNLRSSGNNDTTSINAKRPPSANQYRNKTT